MARDDHIETEGVVSAALGNGQFSVKIDPDHKVLCTLSGKMRKNAIKVLEGDIVKIEISPYDLHRGRIIFRKK